MLRLEDAEDLAMAELMSLADVDLSGFDWDDKHEDEVRETLAKATSVILRVSVDPADATWEDLQQMDSMATSRLAVIQADYDRIKTELQRRLIADTRAPRS